ncbi:MAG: hypothetical protein C5S44_07130 [Candidatus Methanocomedens sp.]|nr:MAG: hypothetical protein C5S44_07130 [ANME-2 cluster archaeon]
MKIEKMMITIIVCIALLAGIGCTEDNTFIIDDYNNYMDTYNQDINTLISKLDAWNSASSVAMADEDLTSEEVEQLAGLAQDYIDESEYVISRSNDFKNFITSNEQVLKDEGVDTQSVKTSISNDIVTMNQNIDTMESGIEEMIQITEDLEDIEELEAILDLLL